MYNTIKLWESKKLENLSKEKDDAIIAIKVTDPTYATIRELKNSSPLMKDVISLKNYTFSKEITEKIAETRADYAKRAEDIHTKASELIMLVSDADSYENAKALAVAYGVINDNGTINL